MNKRKDFEKSNSTSNNFYDLIFNENTDKVIRVNNTGERQSVGGNSSRYVKPFARCYLDSHTMLIFNNGITPTLYVYFAFTIIFLS